MNDAADGGPRLTRILCLALAFAVLGVLALSAGACNRSESDAVPTVPPWASPPDSASPNQSQTGGGQQLGTIDFDTAAQTARGDVTAALQGKACAVGRVSAPEEGCECVEFVVYELFGGSLGGNWPTAESMANPAYWNRAEAGPRYQLTGKDAVLAGDVIIMQHDALVLPWNRTAGRWDCTFRSSSIGGSAGHIGIVESAEYWPEQHGWYIRMQNSNWPSDWGYGYQPRTYSNRVTKAPFTCASVQLSDVFIPDGQKVSFWRQK